MQLSRSLTAYLALSDKGISSVSLLEVSLDASSFLSQISYMRFFIEEVSIIIINKMVEKLPDLGLTKK